MHERLKQLEKNVAELKKIKDRHQEEDIQKDIQKEWALRYGLLESIQIVIDISCHLVVHQNLGNADTYAECIELLYRFDYLDESLKKRLIKMTGLRNILVHEYVKIDAGRLYHLLHQLDDFKAFAMSIKKHLNE